MHRGSETGSHGEGAEGPRWDRERLRSFIEGRLGDAALAEDLAQEVELRYLREARVLENPRAWAYRVARNLCSNARRDGRAREGERGESALDRTSPWTGPLSRLAQVEARAELESWVAELGDDLRELLELRYREDLSRAEIAVVLGIEESLVKSRLFGAIERLRRRAEAYRNRSDGLG